MLRERLYKGLLIASIIGIVLVILFGLIADVFAASLVAKDTSGIYKAKTGERELPDQRTRSFKKFKNGKQYRVAGQIGPIHYRQDPFSTTEQYKEIDLDIIATPLEDWDYAVEDNGYQVHVWNSRFIQGKDVPYIAEFRRAGKSISMCPLQLKIGATIIEPVIGIEPIIDNEAYTIAWKDAFGSGIDYRYNLRPDEFFKTVIINEPLPDGTITLTLGLAWGNDTRSANGFANGVQLGGLPNNIDNTPANEALENSQRFAYLDELGRQVFWMQEPEAWDSGENRQKLDWKLKRHGNKVYAELSVGDISGWQYPIYIDTDISEEQVGADVDDALTRYQAARWYGYTANYVGAGYQSSSFHAKCCGMRFLTIPIPQAATINSAALSFHAYSTIGTSTANTEIQAYDADNATSNLSLQATWDSYFPSNLTTASVDWNITSTWTDGNWYDSPDISSVIQEIIDRPGWVSNNNMIIFWHDYDDDSTVERQGDDYHWDATGAAKFNASYNEASSGQVISIRTE